MFDFDSLREILSTIQKNKLRTVLTGFAVAWGIFMVIVLLAAGNGLRNGVTSNFSDSAKNTFTLWPGWTSMPYAGLPSDRQIKFDERDYDFLRNQIQGVEYISPRISKNATISYEKEYGAWRLDGVSHDSQYINSILIESGEGRFISKIDVDSRRKVIVLSSEMKNILFKDQNPLGKYVVADGIAFRVVGIYDNKNQYMNNPPAYIPFSTAQMLYSKGWGFMRIDFVMNGLKTVEQNQEFVEKLRVQMGELHSFNPEDRSALYIRNQAEFIERTENMFTTIDIFIKIIGAASLLLGIIGVGNIMLITVKERTQEIGIRKAIGAKPISILKLIISEALFLTSIAGYLGLMLGILLSEGANSILESMSSGTAGMVVFKNPTVDLWTALFVFIIVIVAGVFAGLIPALQAVKVKPIEAMRRE